MKTPFLFTALFALCGLTLFPGVGLRPTTANETADDLEEARRYARGLSRAFQHVAQQLEPSVVSIRAKKKVESSRMSAFLQQGFGTGVIVDEKGTIITNNHVIDEASVIEVTLHDGQTVQGTLIGADAKSDLAVLRVDAENLSPATLGDEDELAVGEWVVAMGSPFGLSKTVTAGIVSAKGRANVGIADYEDFIQTDAAINPGNSGGPLLNLDGEVVGINTAIATRSGGSQGIGFAIPVNMARRIMKDLIDDGEVDRGFLGVSIRDLTSDLAAAFDFTGVDGVLVRSVTADGPASAAGLQTGDIILSLDGQATPRMHDLRNRIAALVPGTSIDLEFSRSGKNQSVTVELGSLSAYLSLLNSGE